MQDYFPLDLTNRDELLMALPAFIILAGELAERAGDAFIFGEFDLSVTKYSVLKTLDRLPAPLKMTALKDSLIVQRSSSNITQIVDDLEARALVRRIALPTDRRVWLVEITPEGRELLRKTDVHYLRFMQESFPEFALNDLRDALTAIKSFIMKCIQLLGVQPPAFYEKDEG
jgi:MarR family transcriptional regulator, 2-MHQ and catechol-resistance regulon repressor